MTFRLYKSPEGVSEYQKIGQSYPDSIQDQIFEHHQQLIAWDPNKTERINGITRVKRFDGSEYLIYSETSEGRDKLYGRRHTFFRNNLGKYIQLDVETVRTPNEEILANPTMAAEFDFDNNDRPKDVSKMDLFKEKATIVGEREAYSIPFTKENLDKLHKKCKDAGRAAKQEEITSYGMTKENDIGILVTGSYEQFRNGDFDTLFNYGCIPTKEEKERIDSPKRVRPFVSSGAGVLAATSEEATGAVGVAMF